MTTTDGRFGLSTRLFLDERLDERHIAEIARSGFSAIELVAHRPHFDPTDLTAAPRLASWLATCAVELHSITAVTASSVASGDDAARARAVDEVRAAIDVARHVRFRHVVVHLGTPTAAARPGDNQPGAARRSLEAIVEAATDAGVRVAVEVLPNALSNPDALVRLIEEDLDELDLGICLDYGHAHMMGDLADVIEAVSGYVSTTHVHDNRRRGDDHLPPFSGSIDWDAAMMETQKIGYDGRLVLEVDAHGSPLLTLAQCAAARERLQQAFEWIS